MNDALEDKQVVTCFLESGGEILLLRRSGRVGSYRGRWAGVSGYMESTPEEQALTEIREETGLSGNDVTLVREGEPLVLEDATLATRWTVHPFLFRVRDRTKIRTDWEHTATAWVSPEDLGDYVTVPGLGEALARVLPLPG
jgi:8-oxo-dGTP pyrophosphatase MutT (NUDIX family)